MMLFKIKPLTILSILVALLLVPVCATAQTCSGHIKTQAQLLTEWQSCQAQGLGPGCLTPSAVQDIVCSNGALSQTICALTAASTVSSDAATCATNSQNSPQVNALTQTGPTTLALPGHLPSGGGESMLYMITHSGASDGPTLASGFEYPGGGQPPECNGSTILVNCWSTGTQTDWLPCVTIDTSHIGCGSVLTNMASATAQQFVLRGNSVSNSDVSGTGSTTLSATISNSTSGDLRTIETFGCGNSGCSPSTVSRATSVTDGTNSCVGTTNAFYNGANGDSTDIWDCPQIIGGSSATITVTWPQTMYYRVMCVQEWPPNTPSPDAGLGHTPTGTGANPSYSTSGATTQAGELVLSMFSGGSGTVTPNVGTQLCSASFNIFAQYQTPATLGTATNSATAGAGTWAASVAAFLHQ